MPSNQVGKEAHLDSGTLIHYFSVIAGQFISRKDAKLAKKRTPKAREGDAAVARLDKNTIAFTHARVGRGFGEQLGNNFGRQKTPPLN
jgi:hypothetical protein